MAVTIIVLAEMHHLERRDERSWPIPPTSQ